MPINQDKLIVVLDARRKFFDVFYWQKVLKYVVGDQRDDAFKIHAVAVKLLAPEESSDIVCGLFSCHSSFIRTSLEECAR